MPSTSPLVAGITEIVEHVSVSADTAAPDLFENATRRVLALITEAGSITMPIATQAISAITGSKFPAAVRGQLSQAVNAQVRAADCKNTFEI